jgi:hypothetical protein
MGMAFADSEVIPRDAMAISIKRFIIKPPASIKVVCVIYQANAVPTSINLYFSVGYIFDILVSTRDCKISRPLLAAARASPGIHVARLA